MASSPRSFLLLFVSFFLLISIPALSSAEKSDDVDLDDDVAFLAAEESKDQTGAGGAPDEEHPPYDFENYDDLDGEGGNEGEEEESEWPSVDEKDVVVLKTGNFTEFLKNNSYVMVEFYAPWCGHCQALAPEYAEAATDLKGVAALAKVDATEDGELAQKYDVQGFPTIYFFVDGEMHKAYDGQRSKDAIVTWVKKKTGPSIHNITTKEEAEKVLAAESKIVLGFVDSLVGSDSEELTAASRLEDEVSFYQTTSPDVAKLFQFESEAKRPALILLKNEDEKLSRFDGSFTKSAIAEFVSTNKVPLLINFTRETAQLVFDSPIKNQLILFTTANDTQKYFSSFQEVAKTYKGKFVFVYIQMDNEDYGESVSGYFGVSGSDPRVLVYTGNEDNRKFVLEGEITLSSIKSFASDFLEDKLKPFYKSDPIPEENDGDVKIVVGNNFDEVVLDESKDVLLEIYAPWCGHCQSLEPIYNKLGKYLKGIDSIVIAKLDGTTNEHPRAKADGFPTILFFPAGNKSFDPITVDTDRTVVALYKFLKQHASIPFKLQKPTLSPPKEEPKVTVAAEEAEGEKVKDEL